MFGVGLTGGRTGQQTDAAAPPPDTGAGCFQPAGHAARDR